MLGHALVFLNNTSLILENAASILFPQHFYMHIVGTYNYVKNKA